MHINFNHHLKAPNHSGVYYIFNVDKGKCLVGAATNIRKRLIKHTCCLRNGYHNNRVLQKDWPFTISFCAWALPSSDMFEIEDDIITNADLDLYNQPHRYARADRPVLTDKQLERFWSRVQVQKDDCWPWTGRLNSYNYGRFYIGAGEIAAHKISYFLTYDVWPKPYQVISHLCHNTSCCNPNHLSLGTPYDNMQRGYHPDKYKVTQQQVDEARKMREEGETQQVIADKIDVDSSTVSRILSGVTKYSSRA